MKETAVVKTDQKDSTDSTVLNLQGVTVINKLLQECRQVQAPHTQEERMRIIQLLSKLSRELQWLSSYSGGKLNSLNLKLNKLEKQIQSYMTQDPAEIAKQILEKKDTYKALETYTRLHEQVSLQYKHLSELINADERQQPTMQTMRLDGSSNVARAMAGR